MKVIVLTPLPSPFVEQVFKLLKNDNIEVVPVFYGDASHRETWGEMKWDGLWLHGNIFNKIKLLYSFVEKEKPDRIVIGQYVSLESWFLKFYSQVNSLPYYSFFIEPLIPSGRIKRIIKLAVVKEFYRGCKAIGVMGRRAHMEYGSVFSGKIIECPYSFDLNNMLNFVRNDKNKLCVNFLYSGRLKKSRDPILALVAFHEVWKKLGNKVRLIISGKGELENEILDLIVELGIEDAVIWMNDFEDWEDMRNLYKHADVLVSVGAYNTWSLTIQEAMAAGMGVISTHTTEAASALIINEYNGFLVHHHDLDEIVSSMFRYVNDSELVSLHGKRNRDISKVTDVEVIAKRISKILS